MFNKSAFKWHPLFLIILIAAIGSVFLFCQMEWGPWAFSDSAAYLSAARNIKAGLGPVIINSDKSITPVSEFPPFFPLLLSQISRYNQNYLFSDRLLNSTLFGLSGFLLAWIVYSCCHNIFAAAAAIILFQVSPVITNVFTSFMSEPLFITLVLLNCFLLILFLERNQKFLFGVFVFASSAMPITRYAGLLFIGCYSLLLLLNKNKKLSIRIKHSFSYAFLACTPIIIWFLFQYQKLSKIGGKRFQIDFGFIERFFLSIRQIGQVLLGWFPYANIYGERLTKLILILILIIIGILIFSTFRKLKTYIPGLSSNSQVLSISLLIFAAYLIFIAITHSVTVPQIDIIDRMLSPVIPFLIICFVIVFQILFWDKPTPVSLIFSVMVILLSSRFYFLRSNAELKELKLNGYGYTTKTILQSGFLQSLNSIPSNQILLSNDSALILFYSNRFPIQLNSLPAYTFGTADSYGEKIFREDKAALILHYSEFRNYYGQYADDHLKNLTDGLITEFSDSVGGIYTYPIQQ